MGPHIQLLPLMCPLSIIPSPNIAPLVILPLKKNRVSNITTANVMKMAVVVFMKVLLWDSSVQAHASPVEMSVVSRPLVPDHATAGGCADHSRIQDGDSQKLSPCMCAVEPTRCAPAGMFSMAYPLRKCR